METNCCIYGPDELFSDSLFEAAEQQNEASPESDLLLEIDEIVNTARNSSWTYQDFFGLNLHEVCESFEWDPVPNHPQTPLLEGNDYSIEISMDLNISDNLQARDNKSSALKLKEEEEETVSIEEAAISEITDNLNVPDCFQTENNKSSALKLKEEEQETVKEEVTSKITDNTVKPNIETKIEQEIEEKIFKSSANNTLPIVNCEIDNRDVNIKKKNRKAKERKRKRKERKVDSATIINEKVNPEKREERVDVETIPVDEIPVLQAVDANSLFEQFEASSNRDPWKSTVKNNVTYDTRSNKTCPVNNEFLANVKKSFSKVSSEIKNNSGNINLVEPLEWREFPNIEPCRSLRNLEELNEELMTSPQLEGRCPKIPLNSTLIQLDHDYCKNTNFHAKSCNKTTEQTSLLKSNQNKNCSKFENHHDSINSNEQYNLKMANICDDRRLAVLEKISLDNLLKYNPKDCRKEPPPKQSQDSNNSSSVKNISLLNELSTKTPYIHSALARSIIRKNSRRKLQTDVLPKTNIAQTNPKTQYISVLKNPPNSSQSTFSTISNENVVTTINSLNNEVQNVIIQNTQDTLPHEEKKTNPPRRKLKLSEYLSRNHKIRNDKSKMIEESTLMDSSQASINSEPIKNNPKDSVSRGSETILTKKESNINEDPKSDSEIEMVFVSLNSATLAMKNKKRKENERNEKQKSYERDSRDLSRSRSKSRNKTSRSRKRSRSRSRRSRHRRSRHRSRERRNRYRRSRSNSSSKDRSRSRSISISRSRSISRSIDTCSRSTTRSRSRSVNTRSRSKSRNRSPSAKRSKWSSRYKRDNSSHERYNDTRSFAYHHDDRNHNYRYSYHKSYDNLYDREKEIEMNERRVLYMSGIEDGITKDAIRKRFEVFGPIVNVSLHFRKHSDNYGFVTYTHQAHAFEAISHGNNNPDLPKYKLCFGGRRYFCKSEYTDLDNMRDDEFIRRTRANEEDSFDVLLKEAKINSRQRKV